jgi:hypothetical protein
LPNEPAREERQQRAYFEREGDLRAGDGDDARSEGDPAGA